MGERRKGNVLVVEDDESLLSLFEKVLHQSGFEATASTSLETAQTLFADHQFDALVCDLSVAAGRNIFDFVSAARTRNPDIAVLIVSGYTPEQVALRAQSLGVTVMDKPFTPPELIARISLLLDRTRGHFRRNIAC